DYLSLKSGGNGFAVGDDDGNGVIVQGAIDLLAVNRKGGRAVSADIIDYKYSAHSEGYLKKKYAPQLALYRSVVCAIYGLKESDVSTTVINIRTLKQIDMTDGD
ncbi:MAG: PD-(D/E)XK nuclease family protein, partial [Clostridia bacterium]|nr:PD-(D/E)XK nuclease family protein [Clostridia bacterium]